MCGYLDGDHVVEGNTGLDAMPRISGMPIMADSFYVTSRRHACHTAWPSNDFGTQKPPKQGESLSMPYTERAPGPTGQGTRP